MGCYKKNTAIQLAYRPINYTTGLTDITVKVYDEAGVLFSTTTMTEVVGRGGFYTDSFTPDAVGQWVARITSATNLDDVTKCFEVKLHDADDVDLHVQDVEDKIDIIDSNVDLIKIETDKIQTIDDNVDLIKTETDKIQTIDDNVDLIKTETDKIQTIDDNVDLIKTKTDNLPADTEQVLTDIKDVVDDIQSSVHRGGYFCN